MAEAAPDSETDAVRRFSRFYTSRLGLLREGLLGGTLSLTEARVIYELGAGNGGGASALGASLALDAGHLSRILRALHDRGLIDRQRSDTDRRRGVLSLTDEGRAAFASLDDRSRAQVASLLAGLTPRGRTRLAAALDEARVLLGDEPARAAPAYLLRPHGIGDMGLIVSRQAVLYAEEYGWDASFEALLAEIAAAFIRDFDPSRERCWIAERDGAVAGSVCLVRGGDDTTAKLRLLYVEPDARGLGIGARLVEECLRFARQSGYRRMTLWTFDVLSAARRIYRRAGFRLTEKAAHPGFGHAMTSESWTLEF